MNLVFVEDIYQAYVTAENLHLMCANTTGETNSAGQDKLEITTKIVIPVHKAAELVPKLLELLPKVSTESTSEGQSNEFEAEQKEIRGAALEFVLRTASKT